MPGMAETKPVQKRPTNTAIIEGIAAMIRLKIAKTMIEPRHSFFRPNDSEYGGKMMIPPQAWPNKYLWLDQYSVVAK